MLLAEEQADLSWCEPYAALGQFGVLRTPFREGELREALAPVPRNGNESTVSIGSFRLYGDKGQLEGEGGSVSLTPTEFRLVHYLIEHRGSPVSSDQLLEDVWGWPPGTGSGEVVRAHVRNLRAKVRQLDGGQELIRNYPRRGYAIPPELEVRASSL
ncbi:MAG: winged helix-turn-helix transcriptional regulator [Chloroflexi bacterium]|nr:winged helix-turn-helix transcriptional regulator [Chloroflexota bacterium]